MEVSEVVSTALYLLINEIEEDMRRTEDIPDNLEVFSAVLWLESPERRYALDIAELSLLNGQTPLKILFDELAKRLEKLLTVGGAGTVKVKTVLVLCELIKLLPSIGTIIDTSTSINKILGMRLGVQKLGPAKRLILRVIDDIVHLAVVAGCNPVVIIMADPDVFAVLENLPVATENAVTFKCALGQIPALMGKVSVDQRQRFIERFYEFLSAFFTHCPRVHEKLIAEGLPSAQTVIDELLKWKATPDTETLCLYAALLPFCPQMLQAMMKRGRKSHPVASILHAMSDWKKKKESGRYSIACAILELMDAVILAKNERAEDFKPFKDFLAKYKTKFDTYMFRHKVKGDGHIVGKILTSWLPRYTAVDFAMSQGSRSGADTVDVTKHTLESIKTPSGRANIVNFLKLLFRGYPKQVDLNIIPAVKSLFEDLSTYFAETLNKLGSEQKMDQMIADEAMAIVKFFISDSLTFSPFSLMTLKGGQVKPVTISKQMQKFRAANKTANAMSGILGLMIQIIACTTVQDVGPFIQFVRTFMTCDSSWEQQLSIMKNGEVMKMITDIAKTFRQQIEKAFMLASPCLSQLPSLVYRFLVWCELVLRNTLEKERVPLDDAYVSSIVLSLLMLSAVSGNEIIATCEEVLKRILTMYGGEVNLWLPSKVWEIGGESGTEAAKQVLIAWFGHVAKQLESEKKKVALPQLSLTPVAFETTRERIAAVTAYLCKHVYRLASMGAPGTDVRSLEIAFFETSVKYLFYSGFTDELFTDAFKYLSGRSFAQCTNAIKTKIESSALRGRKCQFEKIFFWNNIVNMCASMLSSNNGTPEERNVLYDNVIAFTPTFLSILQLGVYEDNDTQAHLEKYVSDLYSMLNHFEKCEPRKSSVFWKNIVHTTLEICLRYITRGRQANVDIIFRFLPEMMENMSFELCDNHIDEISSRSKACKSINFVVRACSTLIMWSGSKTITLGSQLIFDNIMISNADIAWKVFMNRIRTEPPLIRSMLLESLMLMFNAIDISVLRSTSLASETARLNPNEEKRTNGQESAKRVDYRPKQNSEKRSSAGTTISENAVVVTEAEARQLQEEIHLWRNSRTVSSHRENYQNLDELLQRNDFELFKAPVTKDIDYIQSAVACCIVFGIHDKLFDSMCKAFIASGTDFSDETPFKLFFVAWFKQMTEKWGFTCMTWSSRSAVGEFMTNFKPPPEFLYYIQRFATLVNNVKLCEELFRCCFLAPVVRNSWDYGATLKTRDDPDEFLKALTDSPKYQSFITSLLNCENCYPLMQPKRFWSAYRQTGKRLFKRPPPCEVRYPIEKSYFGKMVISEMKNSNYTRLVASNWIVSLGQTNLGEAVLITVKKVPDVNYESLLAHFMMHFGFEPTPIEIYADVGGLTETTFGFFESFLKMSRREFFGRVRRLTILNLSFNAARILRSYSAGGWISNIRICDSLHDALDNETICLPAKYFRPKLDHYYWFTVTAMDLQSKLYIGDGEFILSGSATIFENQKANATLVMKVERIKKIEHDGELITILYEKHGTEMKIEIGTQSGKWIVAAWQSMTNRCISPEKSEVLFSTLEEKMSPSARVQAISLTLYLLARDRSLVDCAAMQLFHSAIQNKQNPHARVEPFIQEKGDLDFGRLFVDVSQTGLLADVMRYLSTYISSEDAKTYYHLLPMFVMFLNGSEDRFAITTVGKELLSLCKTKKSVMILERCCWLEIKSQVVLECLVPLVIASDLPRTVVKRILQTFCHHNQAVLGNVIVTRCLDGAVRRKQFDERLSRPQIFAVIPTLPFHALSFVQADPAVLLFSSVISSIYTEPEISANAGIFLESSCHTLASSGSPQILKLGMNLISLMKDAKSEDPMEILRLGAAIAKQMGADISKSYKRMLRYPDQADNQDVWYIRAAAAVHSVGGNYTTAVHFMQTLPEMFSMDVVFGYQKLALCFRCFSRLIKTFPSTSRTPLNLFWVAMLSLLHSNTLLRVSALELISVLCDFAMKNSGFMSIEDFKNHRHDNINHCVSTCEDEIGVRFDDNFALAFINFLARSMEEAQTRPSAIALLRVCISHMSKRPKAALFYILPLIVYAPEECASALACVKTKHSSVPDFVIAKIRKIPEEAGMIIGYLAAMFGCSKNIDLIADCLIAGAQSCPMLFSHAKKVIVEKCFKMLLLDRTELTIEKVSQVAGVFLALEDPVGPSKTLGSRINFGDIVDDNLRTYIIGIINYIGAQYPKTQEYE